MDHFKRSGVVPRIGSGPGGAAFPTGGGSLAGGFAGPRVGTVPEGREKLEGLGGLAHGLSPPPGEEPVGARAAARAARREQRAAAKALLTKKRTPTVKKSRGRPWHVHHRPRRSAVGHQRSVGTTGLWRPWHVQCTR